MTLPNGADGVTRGPLQMATAVMGGEGGIPNLYTLDQETVEALLKQLYVGDNPDFADLLQTVFGGLRAGVSLPLAILEAVAKKLLGLPNDYVFFNVEHVLTAMKKVPGFADLAEVILGIEDGDEDDLGSFFLGIRNAVHGFDLSTPGSILAFIEDALEDIPLIGPIVEALTGSDGDLGDLTSWATGLLTGDSPLDAFNLFNLIPSNLLSLVPYSIIGEGSDNLLTNGGFEGAISVSGGSIWTYDPVSGRTSPGCVSVTANGSEQRLLSNAIPVAEGDKLSHIIYAQWSGLVYTGTPFRTRIVRLLNHNQVGVDNLAAPSSPAASQSGWSYALTGADYVVPAGCDEVCYELTINPSCTAGTIKFDDGWVSKNNMLQIPWTEDLPDSLQDLLDGAQETIDAIFEGITGFGRIGNLLSDVIDALQNIPFLNVIGVGGPADIGSSVQATWDQWISGLVGTIGSGAGLADLYNIGQDISSKAALGGLSWDVLGIRSNKSLKSGFLPTSQSSVNLDTIALRSSAPLLAVTQSTALMSFHVIEESGLKGCVSWQGQGVTNVTHCFVNIWRMNTATGVCDELVHASLNIVGNLSSSMQQNVYDFTADAFQAEPGEVYGIEIAIRGAGTHSVAGDTTWLPDQQVYPRRFGARRNSGTSAAPSSVTPVYTSDVPFVELAVSSGPVAIPHAPLIVQFATAGTTSYPIPSWANYVDRIVLGGAGGGHIGGTWGVGGEGGDNGPWVSDTLARGTHFSGATSLNTVVGAGGAKSSENGGTNGGHGGPSSSSIGGSHVLTSAGGVGANSFDILGSEHVGESPGNYTFPGGGPPWTVVGGVAANGYGENGNPPGGGGSGGNWISFQSGGRGAPGIILYRFRQS